MNQLSKPETVKLIKLRCSTLFAGSARLLNNLIASPNLNLALAADSRDPDFGHNSLGSRINEIMSASETKPWAKIGQSQNPIEIFIPDQIPEPRFLLLTRIQALNLQYAVLATIQEILIAAPKKPAGTFHKIDTPIELAGDPNGETINFKSFGQLLRIGNQFLDFLKPERSTSDELLTPAWLLRSSFTTALKVDPFRNELSDRYGHIHSLGADGDFKVPLIEACRLLYDSDYPPEIIPASDLEKKFGIPNQPEQITLRELIEGEFYSRKALSGELPGSFRKSQDRQSVLDELGPIALPEFTEEEEAILSTKRVPIAKYIAENSELIWGTRAQGHLHKIRPKSQALPDFLAVQGQVENDLLRSALIIKLDQALGQAIAALSPQQKLAFHSSCYFPCKFNAVDGRTRYDSIVRLAVEISTLDDAYKSAAEQVLHHAGTNAKFSRATPIEILSKWIRLPEFYIDPTENADHYKLILYREYKALFGGNLIPEELDARMLRTKLPQGKLWEHLNHFGLKILPQESPENRLSRTHHYIRDQILVEFPEAFADDSPALHPPKKLKLKNLNLSADEYRELTEKNITAESFLSRHPNFVEDARAGSFDQRWELDDQKTHFFNRPVIHKLQAALAEIFQGLSNEQRAALSTLSLANTIITGSVASKNTPVFYSLAHLLREYSELSTICELASEKVTNIVDRDKFHNPACIDSPASALSELYFRHSQTEDDLNLRLKFATDPSTRSFGHVSYKVRFDDLFFATLERVTRPALEAYRQIYIGRSIPTQYEGKMRNRTIDFIALETMEQVKLGALVSAVGIKLLGPGAAPAASRAAGHKYIRELLIKEWSQAGIRIKEPSALKPKEVKEKTRERIVNHPALPDTLCFEALVLFGLESDSKTAIKRFAKEANMRAFRVQPHQAAAQDKNEKPIALYQRVLTDLTAAQIFDPKNAALDLHRNFLLALTRLHYNGNSDQMIAELRELAARQLSPALQEFIKAVTERVVETLEAERTFELPSSIKKKPFAYQISSALDNIYSDHRICGAWMGLGKTLIADILCEYHNFPRILRLVPAGNRDDIRAKILENIEIDPKRVVIIPEDAASWSLETAADFLKHAKYAVCGYETLRECDKRNKALGDFIRNWEGSDGARVYDEAHLLDNSNTQLYESAKDGAASWRYVTTGTLYQDKPSRAATIFNLAYPQQYPDAAALKKLCKDPIYLRMLRDRHCSMVWLDEATLPFEPFSKQSPQQQLADGIPRIPNVHYHPTELVALSDEAGREYLKCALFHNEWLESHGLHPQKPGNFQAFRQLSYLQSLIYRPQDFGLSPPLEMIQRAKELAIPALEKGENVLFLCKHRKLIDQLLKDPELRAHGVIQLDGRQTTRERALLRRDLQDDDEIKCAVAQVRANATGSDLKTITRIINLEVADTGTAYSQCQARAIRVVGENDLRFAKERVDIHHLAMKLSDQTLQLVDDRGIRAALANGTVHEIEHQRARAKEAEYKLLLRRGYALESNGAAEIARYVLGLSRAALQSTDPETLRAKIFTPKPRPNFNTPEKGRYRNEFDRFLQAVSAQDGLPAGNVLTLSGPDGYELNLFDAHNIPRHHIHAVEGGSAQERDDSVSNLSDTGIRLYTSRLEDIIDHFEDPFCIVHFDFDGNDLATILSCVQRVKTTERFVLVKNALAAREKDSAKDLLQIASPEAANLSAMRYTLDDIMLKLIGSAANPRFAQLSPQDSLHLYHAAVVSATELSQIFTQAKVRDRLSEHERAAMFLDLFLEAPFVKRENADIYRSHTNQPFLSRYAYAQKWDQQVLRSDAGKTLGQVMQSLIEQEFPVVEISKPQGNLEISISGRSLGVIRPSEMRLLGEYYLNSKAGIGSAFQDSYSEVAAHSVGTVA